MNIVIRCHGHWYRRLKDIIKLMRQYYISWLRFNFRVAGCLDFIAFIPFFFTWLVNITNHANRKWNFDRYQKSYNFVLYLVQNLHYRCCHTQICITAVRWKEWCAFMYKRYAKLMVFALHLHDNVKKNGCRNIDQKMIYRCSC